MGGTYFDLPSLSGEFDIYVTSTTPLFVSDTRTPNGNAPLAIPRFHFWTVLSGSDRFHAVFQVGEVFVDHL